MICMSNDVGSGERYGHGGVAEGSVAQIKCALED